MNNKGITLIALVITIIVLLILAGVSIAMLTGQNGILTQSSNSKDKTNAAEVAERVNMELNVQLSRAMAGESFNTAEDIVKNIGTLPTGYTTIKARFFTCKFANICHSLRIVSYCFAFFSITNILSGVNYFFQFFH